jgi:hypothetical protein
LRWPTIAVYFDVIEAHATRGQPHELVTLAKQKRVRADNQSAASPLDNRCEGLRQFQFRCWRSGD